MKFNTKINPENEYTDIHYVNAIPGSGKTYQFINHIAKPHTENKRNSVLVYAAPTIILLEQVLTDLINSGIKKKYIHRAYPTESDIMDTPGRVADHLRISMTSKDKSVRIPNGHIVLCTHECLARINHDAKFKNRICLVYDEARACLEDSFSMVLPAEIYDFIMKKEIRLYTVRNPVSGTIENRSIKSSLVTPTEVSSIESATDNDKLSIWQWSAGPVGVPSNEVIMSLLPNSTQAKRTADRICNFLEYVKSSSVDVYVNEHKMKDSRNYKISKVLSPARMFQGYGKVLILSAFFESSQMHHFLSNVANNKLYDDSLDPIDLIDITKQYIDPIRVKKLLQRYKKTKIVYMMDLGPRSLTKTTMMNGIVVKKLLSNEEKNQLDTEWKAVSDRYIPSYKDVVNLHCGNLANRVRHVNQAQFPKHYDLLVKYGLIDNLIDYSIIKFLTNESHRVYKRLQKNKDPLPVVVNASMRHPKLKEFRRSTWETEGLGSIDTDHNSIVQVPVVCHGQNKWQHLNGCAFLATMQYNTDEKRFLQAVIPRYNPRIDRTVDYALQALFRCSIRDSESKSNVYLFVTDKLIATAIRKKMRKLMSDLTGKKSVSKIMEIVPYSEIPKAKDFHFIQYEAPYDSNKNKERVKKYSDSAKGQLRKALYRAYQKTKDGKNYQRLSTAMSRSKDDTDRTKELRLERSRLMTFTEWKKTEEGIQHLLKLTGSSSIKKPTKEKVLSVVNDPRFWSDDRRERLPYILAIKHLGIHRQDITAYPSKNGEIPKKNWNNKKWDNDRVRADRYILARAKKLGIQF